MNSKDLRTVYQTLESYLPQTIPTTGFESEKEKLFWMERDLDRKIQLLMVNAYISVLEKMEANESK